MSSQYQPHFLKVKVGILTPKKVEVDQFTQVLFFTSVKLLKPEIQKKLCHIQILTSVLQGHTAAAEMQCV